MKIKKIGFNYKGKKIELDLKVCNFLGKFSGLMFSQKEKSRALLFNFKKSTNIAIHSFFVFFPFIAIWLDDKKEIIDIKIVQPFDFCLSPKKSFNKLIEIPINKKYSEIVKLLCSQPCSDID